jgi:hypothetical protein
VVPAGIAASQQVPIVMTQAGRAGLTVTVPHQ